MNRILSALARLAGYQHLELSAAQDTGASCVHCARPFVPGEDPEPYGRGLARRLRQCATSCVLELTGHRGIDDLLTARVAATRPVAQIDRFHLGVDDDPDPAWPAAQQQVTLTLSDRGEAGRSGPIPLPYAQRFAQQAARLGFDAEIREHRDTEGSGER